MRAIQMLLCFGLVGCSTVGATATQVKQGAGGLAASIEAAFSGSSKLYDSMNDSDVALAAEAMQVALETRSRDEAVDWRNEKTGNQGSIIPRQTFITDRGVFCRAYDETLSIGDREGTIRNTACRSDDGRWTWTS